MLELYIEIYDDDLGRLHLDKHTLIENEKFQNFDLIIADGIKKLIDNYSTNKILVFTNSINSANTKANAISHLTKNKDYFVDSISSK